MGEHGKTIFVNVLVKQDASLSIAQQARQRSVPVQELEIAQIKPTRSSIVRVSACGTDWHLKSELKA
jgi:hypothetical protein